jgi:P-type E1-E2 ATPase
MSIQAANMDDNVATYVIRALTQSLNYMVVLAVVSIPEGLPLAVGVSLAFSVMKMHGDKLLVRKLDAPEKMGAIEEILCGKSGTVTTGDMKVSIMHI